MWIALGLGFARVALGHVVWLGWWLMVSGVASLSKGCKSGVTPLALGYPRVLAPMLVNGRGAAGSDWKVGFAFPFMLMLTLPGIGRDIVYALRRSI